MTVLIVGWNENAYSIIRAVAQSRQHKICQVLLPKGYEVMRIIKLCQAYRIPNKVIGKEAFNSAVRKANPEIVVSASCPWIISNEIWGRYTCLNVHASLLPKHRGIHPVNWAIIMGDEKSGVTVHLIDREGLDNGPIIMQKAVPIHKKDDAATLRQKLTTLGGPLLVQALDLFQSRKVQFIEQDESRASYDPKRTPEDSKIDWTINSQEIINLIRALVNPYPNAFCTNKRTMKLVRIESAKLMPAAMLTGIQVGYVLKATTNGYLVAASPHQILIRTQDEICEGDVLF
ncbi:methionyl-tRNA formyltransferase [Patescibacteria group bacterium]|nr:methionyl-tRNA formyltransferase [Patescibacteria group bacterium]MBU1970380.1 methionyl-tRNA formyltransferase [Patescibacteria group bacterium]